MPDNDLGAMLDPFAVLGLEPNAAPEEIRRRYLELIRQHPPERDPDRFAEIHAAYGLASDPIKRWSTRLCTPLLPKVDALVAGFKLRPQRFATAALLRCAERITTTPPTHKGN